MIDNAERKSFIIRNLGNINILIFELPANNYYSNKMKKILFLISCFVFWDAAVPTLIQAQINCPDLWNRARVWNFGQHAGLDFNYNPPVPLTNSEMIGFEGCSSVCDINGHLLFYTNGNTVWNGTYNTIITTGLLGGGYSSTQAAMILPVPGSTSKYYIFTTDEFAHGCLYYSIVDSLGAIVPPDALHKNVVLDSSIIVSEKLTAVRHSNNGDFWVISHEAHTQHFLIYLVDTSGISLWSKPAMGAFYSGSSWNQCPGAIKPTCDGSKVALALYAGYAVEIYDFDKTLGLLSNLHTLTFTEIPYGVEFSPNKKFLYVGFEATAGHMNLAQVNMSTNLIIPLNTADTMPFSYRSSLQLGPDGKIYVAEPNDSTVGIISNPDLAGAACNFINNGIYLAGKVCTAGLPNIPWTSGCCYSTVVDTTSPGDEGNCIYYLPNIFTPNSDGKNDILYLRGKGIEYFTLYIYDRWGEKVFQTSDLNFGWDGKLYGKPMQDAVFTYYIKGKCLNGEDIDKKGNVTLVR
jgi:gliding motility-associated-like protein